MVWAWRLFRVAIVAVLSLFLLGALLAASPGGFAIIGSMLAVFLGLTDTFGVRSRLSKLLRRQESGGGTSSALLPVPQPSTVVAKREEIKAQIQSLPAKYLAAVDSLSDEEVAELCVALGRLQLLQNGALMPRKGETVLGHKRDLVRYEWKQRTVRLGSGGGWGFSARIGRGVYLHKFFRSPPRSVKVRELDPVDTGTLYLTTERLYFDGERNINVWYDKLDSLPQWSKEGFLVLQHGEKDILIKVGDGQDAMAWAAVAGFLATCQRDG